MYYKDRKRWMILKLINSKSYFQHLFIHSFNNFCCTLCSQLKKSKTLKTCQPSVAAAEASTISGPRKHLRLTEKSRKSRGENEVK